MMTTRQAWFCPSCQKYHAPHVETCPGGTGGVKPLYNPEPYPGWKDRVGTVPTYTLGPQICGCASPVCREKGCQAAKATGSTYRPDPRVSVSLTNSTGLPQ